MVGQLFAQSGNLFGCDWACAIAPLAPLVGHDVRDLFVSQSFVPWLHHRRAILLPFHFHWALQAFKHDHAHASRAAVCKFGTGKRRILAGHALAIRLMTRLTIRRENLFATIVRRKFRSLLCALRSADFFHRLWLAAVRVERIATKVSRVTAEIRPAKKYRQPVNSD